MKRLFRSLVLIPLFSVTGLLFCGYMFPDRIIFRPPPSGYTDSGETFKLTTSDGARITALFLPNQNAHYTILFSHGNAEDLGTVIYKLKELHAMGFSVLGYDYRGYGTSEGRPSENAVYRDIDAAYEYLTSTLKIPPDQIILDGWSLGGAVAADLASRRPVGGLILESTFVSAFRVVTVVPMPFDKFDTLGKLDKISCPILVIHGRADSVVKFWHGEKLYATAKEPKRFLWVENAGHGDVSVVANEQYKQTLKNFAAEITNLGYNLPIARLRRPE